jgi:hypothetical protein
MSAERFRDELWQSVEHSVVPAILEHPFIKGLVDASLPEVVFRCFTSLPLRAVSAPSKLLSKYSILSIIRPP